MVGKVKFYDARRGYGYITTANEEELFFMRKDIVKSHQHCTRKELVSFAVANDGRAINVQKII